VEDHIEDHHHVVHQEETLEEEEVLQDEEVQGEVVHVQVLDLDLHQIEVITKEVILHHVLDLQRGREVLQEVDHPVEVFQDLQKNLQSKIKVNVIEYEEKKKIEKLLVIRTQQLKQMNLFKIF